MSDSENIDIEIIEEQSINISIEEGEVIVCDITGDIGSGAVVSIPPSNKLSVKNLYVDPDTGKLMIEYDDGN
jgi:hypothetical protein